MTQRPDILFDVSRLLMRAGHAVPTGIDRVELAYTEHLLANEADRTGFVVVLPGGVLWGRVHHRIVRSLVRVLAARWRGAAGERLPWHVLPVAAASAALDTAGRCCRVSRRRPGPAVYLNVSHQQLDRPRAIGGILRWARAHFVVMVHDLIPLAFPEYGRPGQAARHWRRIATVMRLADGILTNSAATRDALAERFAGCRAPVRVVPLGVEPAAPGGGAVPMAGQPYFICLGTIEPRKNHLLLLHTWRRLVQEGEIKPHLYIVGRRGWENEMVVDLLERCQPIHPYLHECNNLSDAAVRALLRGARALLMPSFAEGYGLPLAEALAEGVPVLCSDLPAHREIGGDVPDYLDPLDGPAWIRAVRDYVPAGSARRRAQLARLQGWRPPRWDTHMTAAIGFVDGVARCQPATGRPAGSWVPAEWGGAPAALPAGHAA